MKFLEEKKVEFTPLSLDCNREGGIMPRAGEVRGREGNQLPGDLKTASGDLGCPWTLELVDMLFVARFCGTDLSPGAQLLCNSGFQSMGRECIWQFSRVARGMMNQGCAATEALRGAVYVGEAGIEVTVDVEE